MHPPYSIEGRDVTGKMRDYTAHMYISKEKTSARRRQAKEYTPHPLWLVLPDPVSEPPGKRRQRDTEAMRRSDGEVLGVHSRRHWGKNTFCFTYPPQYIDIVYFILELVFRPSVMCQREIKGRAVLIR